MQLFINFWGFSQLPSRPLSWFAEAGGAFSGQDFFFIRSPSKPKCTDFSSTDCEIWATGRIAFFCPYGAVSSSRWQAAAEQLVLDFLLEDPCYLFCTDQRSMLSCVWECRHEIPSCSFLSFVLKHCPRAVFVLGRTCQKYFHPHVAFLLHFWLRSILVLLISRCFRPAPLSYFLRSPEHVFSARNFCKLV